MTNTGVKEEPGKKEHGERESVPILREESPDRERGVSPVRPRSNSNPAVTFQNRSPIGGPIFCVFFC